MSSVTIKQADKQGQYDATMTVIHPIFSAASADGLERAQDSTIQPTAMLLSMAKVGQPLRLLEVRAGHKLAHRMAELGLTPGVSLTIVQDAGGPLLIAVRGARMAIGRDLAEQIQVAPI